MSLERSTSNRVPEKNTKVELMDVARAGRIAACHPSTWIQTCVFTKLLGNFVRFIKPSTDDPVLLIVDGHYSHTKNLDVVDKAREQSVSLSVSHHILSTNTDT